MSRYTAPLSNAGSYWLPDGFVGRRAGGVCQLGSRIMQGWCPTVHGGDSKHAMARGGAHKPRALTEASGLSLGILTGECSGAGGLGRTVADASDEHVHEASVPEPKERNQRHPASYDPALVAEIGLGGVVKSECGTTGWVRKLTVACFCPTSPPLRVRALSPPRAQRHATLSWPPHLLPSGRLTTTRLSISTRASNTAT